MFVNSKTPSEHQVSVGLVEDAKAAAEEAQQELNDAEQTI